MKYFQATLKPNVKQRNFGRKYVLRGRHGEMKMYGLGANAISSCARDTERVEAE